MNKRYIQTLTLILTAMLTSTTAMAQGVVVHGNVYGGGNQADVKRNTEVNICAMYDETNQTSVALPVGDGVTIEGNVFGGGKGVADNFTCDKAMVGDNNYGETVENYAYGNTTVRIGNGTIGNGTTGGDVYGGGEIGRVEMNTTVEIGSASGTSEPIIKGHVFGAGKGLETHGYSALVRGNSTVTIQGKAQVWKNVHGGGEKASVGRYYVAQNQTDADTYHVRIGMPCYLKAGGKCTVNIQDEATIGKEANTGDVYGAGQGVTPIYNNTEDDKDRSKRMVYKTADHNDGNRGEFWDYYVDEDGNVNTGFVWEFFATNDDYLLYIETLGRASETDVVIGGMRKTTGESAGTIAASTAAPTVKGTVYGGSESGFVYYSTAVNMLKGTVNGDVFGGGKGLLSFAEAGRVRRNTNLTVSGGSVKGNVYGGGSLGDVGAITKPADYNYIWTQTDGSNANTHYNNDITGTNTNTGICKVTISGGTIGTSGTASSEHGNVFGAGRGLDDTWWCEKAIAFATDVSVTAGTVNGNVYGGGQIGRVEDDAKVTIGDPAVIENLVITGSVFGAGAGKKTHGYSALVRGNSDVTIQGIAKVRGNVYGGGEIASVGRFKVISGLPSKPQSGGTCKVAVKDNAEITGSVFGACKGVESEYVQSNYRDFCSMQTYAIGAYQDNNLLPENDYWNYCEPDHTFIWRYYPTEAEYLVFLKTLALTSNTEVAINGAATVNGSVYGGGELGVTLGNSTVDMLGGTVNHNVFGGGSFADTNTTMWDATNNRLYDYVELDLINGLSHVTGYYEKSGNDYTLTSDVTAQSGHTYYAVYKTKVNLLGGTIVGDAYGGGLGRLAKAAVAADPDNNIAEQAAVKAIEAKVYGDVQVNLNGMGTNEYTSAFSEYLSALDVDNDNDEDYYMVKSANAGCIVNRIFGCNDLNGTPKGNVTVHVYATQNKDATKTTIGAKFNKADYSAYTTSNFSGLVTLAEGLGINVDTDKATLQSESASEAAKETALSSIVTAVEAVVSNKRYDLKAVYGGGNEAAYIPAMPNTSTTSSPNGARTQVIIEGCDYTSIETVYGGGNAAPVPEANVTIHSDYEIETVFGGGNGKDAKESDGSDNEGADIGTLDHGTTTYGTGNANTMITGGYIHEAYGGSNERGTITGTVNLKSEADGICSMVVGKMVTAGKNADIMGDAITILGCMPSSWVEEYYGGADNANVHGNVELTITSGNFRKVFGGNNKSGIIMGHIKVNIEETGCIPINIDELYLGGNEAAYSTYGYYLEKNNNDEPVLTGGKLTFKPRESETDTHLAVTSFTGTTYTEKAKEEGVEYKFKYDVQPELNVISCTRIGEVFGGGLGETAIVYGNPTVNINMEPGAWANQIDHVAPSGADNNANALGEIGDVYGGGNAAAVYGNTTVNIGTATKVQMTSIKDNDGNLLVTQPEYDVTGAYITGNVYGGGKLANVGETHLAKDENNKDIDVIDIEGSTFVNIGAVKRTEILDAQNKPTGRYNYTSVSFTPTDAPGIFIGGNVYGGGMGEAAEPEGTNALPGAFRCGKAMVTKNTNVAIGNGTIGDGNADHGHVYGGGEKGRVEENTSVTIGCENDANSKPVITGNVFGAGKGVNTHGYSALTRGNSYVTVQGEAKVKMSVYGGGEIASVGKYNINAQGLPESLANQNSGYCTVFVRDNAVIGPDAAMVMTATGYPDDKGHVFGAGKGVLPYEGYAANEKAWRVKQDNTKQEYLSKTEAIAGTNESSYLPYVETLGLATQTYVTIDENAFVKGSVYGGSENGYVQHDTQVNIRGNCQIGNGYVQMNDNGIYLDKLDTPETPVGVNRRYTDAEWSAGKLIPDQTKEPELYTLVNEKYYTSSLPECASWPYGQASGAAKYAPWDMYDGTENYDSKGGRTTADDGHTFYGNVFGGGSGVIPYRPGKWHPEAGSVGGNTEVNITGGHILTNIYGGNELTDVYGKCTVNFGGTTTLGVPRTLKQIAAHPLTCYLFGAGKGDQRVLFNKKTNVKDVEVNITGGTIYGSVFGGGEDGHVHRDVKMTIGTAATAAVGTEGEEGYQPAVAASGPTIGQWGTSYVDGNIFGGGRGFGADAYTAGNVAGSVKLDIKGGSILGSVYGGGRLGSVGYGLFDEGVDGYGEMRPDNNVEESNPTSAENFKRGYIDITISGGTIGNNREYIIPNTTPSTGNAPSELENTDFKTWTDAQWQAWKEHNKIPKTEFDTTTGHLTHTKGGNVFAGGMGNFYKQDGQTYINGVDWWKLGNAKSTTVTITGGTIKSNVYGGGELGQVVGYHTTTNAAGESINASTEISISGSETQIGTEVVNGGTTEYTFGSVFGGGYGSLLDDLTVNGVTSHPKYDAGLVKEDTKIDMRGGTVKASIYGGGEMACVGGSTTSGETTTVTGSTYVSVSGGTVGIAPIEVSDTKRYFGGAKMGNVYGGGSGHNNTVRSGRILKNTNVTISDGTIYHNVYGGGAYGTVGDFEYQTGSDYDGGPVKVQGINDLATTGTGVANVTITGGTIGYDGKENGMVFGSSRGDINEPGARDDHCAWVYDTHVTIGDSDSETGPQIKGTVYGSGENGHVFHDTEVNVYSGTIGIASGSAITYTENGQSVTKGGAEYPYRGNVYGGGCGTDKYYENHDLETHDGNGQLFNSLAGIVYGTTTVNITGGTVVRNVYGAGAMGSVGRTVTTTNSDNSTTTTYSGGSTTINVSGGVIGVSGTVGDGNVFGAARGDLSATGDYISQVRLTKVTVSGGTVKGNVYGGGELGDVGTIDKSDQTDYNYYWTDKDGSANIHGNNGISGTNNNTGICTVTVSGGTIGTDATTMNADGSFDNGNVFGAGKGSGSTWWCEKAIAYGTNVTVTAGTVKGSVYGGGEVGRVEDDAKVTIGSAPNDAPTINGSVFGAGKGLKTHGYSALVRGNAEVIVQGKSVVRGSVYGGGEIASVGRFHVDKGLPVKPMNGGTCKVLIQDEAQIGSSGTGHNVFGACKGVKSAYDLDNYKNFKSMQTEANGAKGTKGTDWDYYEDYPQGYTGHKFVWKYYTTEAAYLSFLKTLALTSNTHVTIDEDASVYGSVFGGGERGVTLGGVDVNITGGTVNEDVYGGGSLADSNVAMWNSELNQRVTWVSLPELIEGTSATGYYTAESTDALITDPDAVVQSNTSYYANYKTNVNLTGGTVEGNVFGGGLGQLEKAAVNYTEEEAVAYNTEHSLTEDDADYKTTASVKVAAQSAVAAKVYGNVSVKLNEPTTSGQTTTYGNCEVKGAIFGCNNLNGSPQAGVDVHIYKTVKKNDSGTLIAKPAKNTNNYEVTAVYGGGNLAAYYPDDETVREAETTKAYVTIDGCELTSIGSVYGGGNAASVPATEVVVNGTYEIGEAFGGGNGKDDISYDGTNYVTNPGANVGYRAYPEGTNLDGRASYAYGIGKAHITIYGGTVHTVYGGSNLRGNVRVESRTTLEELGQCDYNVGDAFGGGNNADQDGDAILDVGCIRGLDIAYGGASNADVNGDVILNLTNGTYGRVFGGNNLGGAIRGSILVNIEETGCNPIVIGELYCGGNKAAYSVYGYDDHGNVNTSGDNPVPHPVLNVKSFTSIGKIFGGGYGSTATLVGNPTVNINVCEGKYYNTFKGSDNVINDNAKVVGSAVKYSESDAGYANGYPIPSHAKGAIGAINDVFGGGNEAKVIGNPTVNIGTEAGEEVYVAVEVKEGEELKGYCTRTGEGTTENPYQYSELTEGTAETTSTYYLKTVKAVDIRDNVFGGGNNAEVEGDTNVVIGKKKL